MVSGRSSVWVEHLLREQRVAGSNAVGPTTNFLWCIIPAFLENIEGFVLVVWRLGYTRSHSANPAPICK